jgi:hypothetical protein
LNGIRGSVDPGAVDVRFLELSFEWKIRGSEIDCHRYRFVEKDATDLNKLRPKETFDFDS